MRQYLLHTGTKASVFALMLVTGYGAIFNQQLLADIGFATAILLLNISLAILSLGGLLWIGLRIKQKIVGNAISVDIQLSPPLDSLHKFAKNRI